MAEEKNNDIVLNLNNVPNVFQNFLTIIDSLIEDEIYERTLNQSMNTYNEELFRKSKDKIVINLEKTTLESLDNLVEPLCRICLETFVSKDCVYRLPCTHDFHCVCLEDAVQRKHMNCPLCRSLIPLQIEDEKSEDQSDVKEEDQTES